MKQDDLGAPSPVPGFVDVSAFPVFEAAVPAAERRTSERDGPSRRIGPRVGVQGTVRLRGHAKGPSMRRSSTSPPEAVRSRYAVGCSASAIW